MNKVLELLRPSFLSCYITFILLFLILLLKANLVPPGIPISVNNSEARAWFGTELVVLEYKRDFRVREDFIGTVIRSVKCNNGNSYDLPDTTRKFTEGPHKTHRTVMLPYTIEIGTKCTMTTSVAWQPKLSFTRFIQNVEEVPFQVYQYNPKQPGWLPTDEEG